MANSRTTVTADGSTQSFAVNFPFIKRSHVDVLVDGVSSTFTWVSDGQVNITSPTLTGGEAITIVRDSSQSIRLADFSDNSNLTEIDLDIGYNQTFFMAQEALDRLDVINTNLNTSGLMLIADGTEYVGKVISGDATISNTGVLDIASDVIVDADINSAAAIDASKIANGSVSDAEFQYLDGVTSAIQTQIDAVTASTNPVTLAGSYDYLSIASQVITLGQIDLTTDVTGDLPVTEGGTGSSSASGARTNLGVDAAGTDNSTDVTLAGHDYLTISGQEITAGDIDVADLADGTDGELITWSAA